MKRLLVIGGLVLATAGTAAASLGDGWRWPRYDTKPVKIHIVVDQQFDQTLLTPLKAAAKRWEATGDLRFDFPPKPVKTCDTMKAQTICVSSVAAWDPPWNAYGGWSWQAPPVASLTDGTKLLYFARAWINTIYVSPGDTTWPQHVFCHELGHDIGFDHSELQPAPYQPSCMSNDFDGGFYSTYPSQEDLAFLHMLYAVMDKR